MQMKQFSGATVNEVLLKVRAELGEDAVILQTKRVVNGGVGGFFGRQGVEVTAAEGLPPEETEMANREAAASVAPPRRREERLEEPPAEAPPTRSAATSRAASPPPRRPRRLDAPRARPRRPRRPPRTPARRHGAPALRRRRPRAQPRHPRGRPRRRAPGARVGRARSPAGERPRGGAPGARARALRARRVRGPARAGARAGARSDPEPAAVAPEPVRPRPAARRAANLDAVHNELIRAGVDERHLDRFLEGFAHGVAPFLEAGDAVRDAVRDYIASRLPVVREWKPSAAGHTLAFVGQSGVGKTSAAACLAGRYRAAGLAVALVAAGEGPHDALEGHARRLDVQLFRAADGAALATLCGTLADRDLVVIDTAGRSHQQPGRDRGPGRPAGAGQGRRGPPGAARRRGRRRHRRRPAALPAGRGQPAHADQARRDPLPRKPAQPADEDGEAPGVPVVGHVGPRRTRPGTGRRVAEMLLP